jgi:MFS family permease
MLVLGNFVTGLGAQATLVALPYQVYVQTKSPLLTGLLGLAELGPLIAMALLGGALADRVDRRKLLLVDQLAIAAITGGLFAVSVAGEPPVIVLFVCSSWAACWPAPAPCRTWSARRSCPTSWSRG